MQAVSKYEENKVLEPRPSRRSQRFAPQDGAQGSLSFQERDLIAGSNIYGWRSPPKYIRHCGLDPQSIPQVISVLAKALMHQMRLTAMDPVSARHRFTLQRVRDDKMINPPHPELDEG